MNLPVVLDASAADAYVRGGASSIAVEELLNEISSETGTAAALTENIYDAMRKQTAAEADSRRRLKALLSGCLVQVVGLTTQQVQFTSTLAAAYGLPLGDAESYVLALDLRASLATYAPATALRVLPGRQVLDLGQAGHDPVW